MVALRTGDSTPAQADLTGACYILRSQLLYCSNVVRLADRILPGSDKACSILGIREVTKIVTSDHEPVIIDEKNLFSINILIRVAPGCIEIIVGITDLNKVPAVVNLRGIKITRTVRRSILRPSNNNTVIDACFQHHAVEQVGIALADCTTVDQGAIGSIHIGSGHIVCDMIADVIINDLDLRIIREVIEIMILIPLGEQLGNSLANLILFLQGGVIGYKELKVT